MTTGQLHPLEVNPHTGEPFLRLPAPNDNIILTPPRMSDTKSLAPIINDPRVSTWLEGPPIPYCDEYAEEWLPLIIKQSEDILAALRKEDLLHPGGPLKVVGGCISGAVQGMSGFWRWEGDGRWKEIRHGYYSGAVWGMSGYWRWNPLTKQGFRMYGGGRMVSDG